MGKSKVSFLPLGYLILQGHLQLQRLLLEQLLVMNKRGLQPLWGLQRNNI